MMMNRMIAISIYVCSGMLAALSQLLLKIAANENGQMKGLKKLLNFKVIVAYGMLFATIFMNMIAMRYMPYKYTPILATISYIFVLILSRLCLHEKIKKKQMMGTILIFAGIVIFNLS